MTMPVAPPAGAFPDKADLEAFVAGERDQAATAEGRFVREPVPHATAVNAVLGWLRAQGLDEALPENLDVILSHADPKMMVVRRFRWKAGDRTNLDHVARRGGVEITEHTYHPIRRQFTHDVVDAFHAARVPIRLVEGPLELPVDERESYVDAVPGGRPAMLKRHADLYDLWLAPNGIVEWLPERTTFVVASGQITYESFRWRKRGFDPGELVLRRELEPFLDADKGVEAALEHRTVPLLAPLTDQVRELFAASELTLTEVK
jgi:hypothetical protein